MKKKELRRQRHLAAIAKLDMEIQERAKAIVADYLHAPEADLSAEREEERFPAGWSPRRKRVAVHGNMAIKQQPGYLAAAVRIAESYNRANANQPAAPQSLAVDVKVYVKADTYNYPVVDIEDKDRR